MRGMEQRAKSKRQGAKTKSQDILPFAILTAPRLKTILKRVAQEIESQDRDHNGETRIGREVRRDQQELPAFIEHRAPGGCRRFYSQS